MTEEEIKSNLTYYIADKNYSDDEKVQMCYDELVRQRDEFAAGLLEWKDNNVLEGKRKKVGEKWLYCFIGEPDQWLNIQELLELYKQEIKDNQ